MVIKVHGAALSTCTQRVLTVLVEKDIPYEMVTVTDFKSIKQPAWLKMQPFGKIPVLEDDGFFVFESRAIAKYLAVKYADRGTKLVPEVGDLKGFALFEQACSIEQSYFDSPASGIANEKVFKPMKGGSTDEAALKRHGETLDSVLAVYETILSKQKYLAGDTLTLADLFHLPYATMSRNLGYASVYDKYPHVAKWLDDLQARESWGKVVALGKH